MLKRHIDPLAKPAVRLKKKKFVNTSWVQLQQNQTSNRVKKFKVVRKRKVATELKLKKKEGTWKSPPIQHLDDIAGMQEEENVIMNTAEEVRRRDKEKAQEALANKYNLLIKLQSANGSWKMSDSLALDVLNAKSVTSLLETLQSKLGMPLEAEAKLSAMSAVWATALALGVLEVKFKHLEIEWSMMHGKAVRWMNQALDQRDLKKASEWIKMAKEVVQELLSSADHSST